MGSASTPTQINAAFDLLGRLACDRVTGFKGVVTSISFDLYGCVQAAIHPGLDKDGKMREAYWLDTNRLEFTTETGARVMEPPDFNNRLIESHQQFDHGAAEKPAKP